METIKFNLPIFNHLNLAPLKISEHTVPVEFELTAGKHVFNSEPIEIGTFFHYKVFGNISIPYNYDTDMKYITIAGSDDCGDKQIIIHTSLEKHPKMNNSHQLNNHSSKQVVPNVWKNFIDTSPVFKQAIKTSIRHAIDTIVQRLLEAGLQGVIQTNPAPIITPNNYQDYKAMFMPKKIDVSQPTLNDLLEVQTIVFSTYYGTITWNLNYSFANIIGSTYDPKPVGYASWIGLWADKCNGGNNTDHCSSFNYSDGKTPFGCNTTDFVGGHVIPGMVAGSVAKGGTAYIFPICKAHNNNNSIYMSMRYNPTGIVLHNYNQ